MENPFQKRAKPKDACNAGRQAERNLSKRLGVNQQPGSGASESAKGDLKGKQFLIESKTSTSNSFSISLEQLTKIKFEARDMDKSPALAVNFVLADGKPKPYGSWVLVEESMYKKIMDLLDEGT